MLGNEIAFAASAFLSATGPTERSSVRLTRGELRVMRLLWDHEELTPPELLELYDEPIKDPALRSYLTILMEKGHVKRRRVGKAFAYRAVTPKRRAFVAMVSELADAFCDGSLRSLMMNLAEHESLSKDDLQALQKAARVNNTKSTSSKETKPKSKGSRSSSARRTTKERRDG